MDDSAQGEAAADGSASEAGAAAGTSPLEDEAAVPDGAPESAEPAAPEDPDLPGYAPCDIKGRGSGSGSFGEFSGRYVGKNIFVAEFPFRGSLGRVDVRGVRRKGSTRNVAYIDFAGAFSARKTELREGSGPVANMKYGRHAGHARLSFNFLDDLAPQAAALELFCRPGFLAVKVTMDSPSWPEDIAAAAAAAEAPEGSDSGVGAAAESSASGEEAAAESAASEVVAAAESLPSEKEEAAPDSAAASAEPAAPEDPDLPGYAPCDLKRSGAGSGSFGEFSGRYLGKDVFIAEFPFRGSLGRVAVRNIRRKRITRNVAYIDFAGEFSARKTELREGGGPVANMKYGRHEGHTRLSFNFLDDLAPQGATLELFCRQGFLAIKLTMDRPRWLEEAPANAVVEDGADSAENAGASGGGSAQSGAGAENFAAEGEAVAPDSAAPSAEPEAATTPPEADGGTEPADRPAGAEPETRQGGSED
jgi:hypothetical protein